MLQNISTFYVVMASFIFEVYYSRFNERKEFNAPLFPKARWLTLLFFFRSHVLYQLQRFWVQSKGCFKIGSILTT